MTELNNINILLTVEVDSAAGTSLPKAETLSFTEGVDVCRRKERKVT